MNISIEISMYPLTEHPYPVIDDFLNALHKTEGLRVQTSVTSTLVFGDAALIFSTLEKLITEVYGRQKQCPFVIKVLNGDVSGMDIKDYKA